MTASALVRERPLAIVLVDLARFSPAANGLDLNGLARVVDSFYRLTAEVITAHGGRVVKYLGDACLAVFEADDAASAVEAASVITERVAAMARDEALDVEAGINIHLSTVGEGELGPDQRHDVIGTGVIHTFRMGNGAGIRISEPVYRKLASESRGPWRKHQPPATYTRT